MTIGATLDKLVRTARGLPVPVLHRLSEAGGVALTIDDGPTPDATPGILDALRRHKAVATFFVSGERAATQPELLAAMVGDGHRVCNHGFAHLRLDQLDEAAVAADLDRAEKVLERARPAPSPYPLRLPFGEGWRSRSLHRALLAWRSDVRIVHWTRHAHDWEIVGRCQSSADLGHECRRAAAELTASKGLPGAILLAHDRPIDATHPLSGAASVIFIEHVLEMLAQAAIPTLPLRVQ